jgi:hypothetical protein
MLPKEQKEGVYADPSNQRSKDRIWKDIALSLPAIRLKGMSHESKK